jgi:hypothetical protein
MAASISTTVALNHWEEDRELARAQVRTAYALSEVCRQWTDLLTG